MVGRDCNMELSVYDLKQGGEHILKKLIALYWGRLYKFALTFVLDQEAAKEIVQDVFLAVWGKRDTFNDDLNLAQYLLKSVKNKSFNYLRDLKLDTISVDNLEHDDIYRRSNLYVLEDHVLEELFVQDLEDLIQRSLQKVSQQTQEIFQLSRQENKSNKEIAQIMHLSEKAVEYHISKVIKQIKSDLPKEYQLFTILLLAYYF